MLKGKNLQDWDTKLVWFLSAMLMVLLHAWCVIFNTCPWLISADEYLEWCWIFQVFIAVFEIANSYQDWQELWGGQLLYKSFSISFYSMYPLYTASSEIQNSSWDFHTLKFFKLFKDKHGDELAHITFQPCIKLGFFWEKKSL